MTVHRSVGWRAALAFALRRSAFGVVVLGAPALGLPQGGGDDGGVVAFADGDVFPDEPRQAVLVQDVGGEPVGLGGVDAGLGQDCADDGGAVGLVLGEGLAGPVPRDQDAPAAEAEVVTVVGLGRACARDQAGARVLG